MINVYCLTFSNGVPFYVGVTKGDINKRLKAHINEAKNPAIYHDGSCSPKNQTIKNILSKNELPKIALLQICNLSEVDFYEYFYYTLFMKQGFKMYQQPHSFIYSKVQKAIQKSSLIREDYKLSKF